MSASVVVDASVWIPYLRQPGSLLGAQVRRLLDGERALVTSLTLAEMLQGARSEDEFDGLHELFQDVPRIVETEADWVGAARLTSNLRRKGVTIPLIDGCLATVCLRRQALLLTLDGDFDRVPGLRRLRPESRG